MSSSASLLSPRKLFGLGLYFLGLGLWVIALCWVVLTALPSAILLFLTGYGTGMFQRRDPWPAFRAWWGWTWLRTHYFRFKERPMPPEVGPSERVLYAVYPHGHFSISAVFYWALNPQRFPHTRPAIHSFLFYLPVVGPLAYWIHALPVTAKALTEAMQEKTHSIIMCPGGVADIANTGHHVQKRQGFLRLARKTNTPVVPVWCPQERSYYAQWLPFGRWMERWLYFPFPLFLWGAWFCPLLPRRPTQGGGESPILLGTPVRWDEGNKPLEEGEREFWREMERLQKIGGEEEEFRLKND